MPKAKFNAFRDGLIHVRKTQCATCVYNPKSPVFGTDIKARARKSGMPIICHSTIGSDPKENAVCNGFFRKEDNAMLKVATAFSVIKFQEK